MTLLAFKVSIHSPRVGKDKAIRVDARFLAENLARSSRLRAELTSVLSRAKVSNWHNPDLRGRLRSAGPFGRLHPAPGDFGRFLIQKL
jgi:hypothetical protein